jgi:hypothetical protein
VVLLVALAALPIAACGGESATSPSTTAPTSAATWPASLEATPSPPLSQWSPGKLQAALPGFLAARGKHPRLDLVSADGARAVTLWRPPAGLEVGLVDCDPDQGRILVHIWDPRFELGWTERAAYGTLVLLAEDGSARRLVLPGEDYADGAVLLADGSILCNSANEEAFPATTLLWTDGDAEWERVRAVGRPLREPGIVGLAPMAGRRSVAVMTWEGALVLPAAWHRATLTVSGDPFHADPPFAMPLSTGKAVLLPLIDELEDRLSVDLVEVRWTDGRPRKRVVVDDGPQTSGHDSLPLIAAGPRGSVLVLGWQLDGESASGDGDDPRLHHWRRLDLATGQLTACRFEVPSGNGWRWLEQ